MLAKQCWARMRRGVLGQRAQLWFIGHAGVVGGLAGDLTLMLAHSGRGGGRGREASTPLNAVAPPSLATIPSVQPCANCIAQQRA